MIRGSLPMLRLCALLLTLFAPAGCASYEPKGEPSFYHNLARPYEKLDAAAAASMISGYRHNNGLPAVTLDPALMRMAEAQAEVMAKRNKLDHSAGRAVHATAQGLGL